MGWFNSTSQDYMSAVRIRLLLPIALSLVFHAGLLALWMVHAPPHSHRASTASASLQASLVIASVQEMKHAHIEHLASGPLAQSAKPPLQAAIPSPPRAEEMERAPIADSIPTPSTSGETLASMPAPPPPTPEEWTLASTYTLKNSKRYRYNWGQLVRSMMGTAVEGPQQGLVRFRIEIAPDGELAKVEVLWSTSETAEKRALHAIRSLPPLPPTPTGNPLVFEKTIAFVPFETGWPPIYKHDCLPDPPSFHNAFAWSGTSPQRTSHARQENASPSGRTPRQAECPPGSAPDSIEAEEKDMERQFKEWGAARLNGAD
jgi:TonB family protein